MAIKTHPRVQKIVLSSSRDIPFNKLDMPRNGSASGSRLGGFSFECNG